MVCTHIQSRNSNARRAPSPASPRGPYPTVSRLRWVTVSNGSCWRRGRVTCEARCDRWNGHMIASPLRGKSSYWAALR
eukprot:1108336-Prymnesium_polylepis.2